MLVNTVPIVNEKNKVKEVSSGKILYQRKVEELYNAENKDKYIVIR